MDKRRSFYRTHAHYLRARIKVLQTGLEESMHESHRRFCERLLSKARRELEFGDVEQLDKQGQPGG